MQEFKHFVIITVGFQLKRGTAADESATRGLDALVLCSSTLGVACGRAL
jgi:hypothetical protein